MIAIVKHLMMMICLHIENQGMKKLKVVMEIGSPSEWGKGIINPIPESSTTDPRDLLQYRGITLTSCLYKTYCSIIIKMLSRWVESKDMNGFRKDRNIIDQISALTNIVETRQKRKLCKNFCRFL